MTEVARAQSARGEVVLRARDGGVLELRVNGVFVMDTAETTSERALATAALALVPRPRRVLVGGLGLGYTAREVLADPRVEQVTVVELESAVAGWLRDGTVPHGPALLADPRLELVVADVHDVLGGQGAAYDLVLLDVDNGPGYLVYDANAALYGPDFLRVAARRVAPGGVLVVWSASPAPDLHATLRDVFGNAAEQAYDVGLQGRDERYHLYTATAPA